MDEFLRKIKKICFHLKLRFLDWEFYTFNPLSKGLRYPPSFYALYTPEEQQKIKEQDMARYHEYLRLLTENTEKTSCRQQDDHSREN